MNKDLEEAARTLNEESEELNRIVAQVDALLKRLNLGVEAWVIVPQKSLYLGYARVERTWGLAIRSVSPGGAGEEPIRKEWLFKDAPRAFRIDSINSLGRLFHALTQSAHGLAQEIMAKRIELAQIIQVLKKREEQP